MRINVIILGSLALAAAGAFAQSGGGQTFTGQIMDSSCAGSGGHQTMEKEHNAPDNPRACTRECVKMGAKYVLYNPDTNTTYMLDDQKKPESLAGENVRVNGALDASANTIHVRSITPAS